MTERNSNRNRRQRPLFVCLECGHKFYSYEGAARAMNIGCPGCGGVDVDLYVCVKPTTQRRERGGGDIKLT